MDTTWTVDGASWSETINCDSDSHPIEVASRILERRFNTEGLHTDLGIILEISHPRMKSEAEHVVVLTSAALANAGFHSMARELEAEIDKFCEDPNS